MIGKSGRGMALAAVLLQGATAFGQSSEDESELALAYGDKASVSIATGHQQSLHRAPAVASVITAEDIAAMGATDIDQVLEAVPGVHVSRGAVRAMPVYVMRGLGAGMTNPQVLLLQNGIPMTIMYTSDKGNAWIGVPVENIARIEVIRGPGSALYGADAYAGVINIITKTAADVKGTEFGVRAGSFNTKDAWVLHGGHAGPVEVSAYLRFGSSDGYREKVTPVAGGIGPINVGYDAVDGSLDAAYDKWRFRSSYKLRDNLGTGTGVGTTLDPNHTGRMEELTADLSCNDLHLTENWGAGATASTLYYSSVYKDNILMAPPSGAFPSGKIGGPNQWERELRLSAFVTYSGFSGHDLRIGAGRDDLDIYKTRTYRNFWYNGAATTGAAVIDFSGIEPHIRPQKRTVTYWYAQDEWNLARDWTLTAGLRHDKYSDFGGTTNPRVALVWEAAYDVTAKLLYGRAFRAPSFNELYGINPRANGNASLQPEKIGTGEAAVSWQARKDLQLNASLFRYDAKDLIRLVGTRYANTGRQHGTGGELEAIWDAGRNLRVTVNYSQQKSIDESTDKDAGYAPRQHWYARADWLWTAGWMASAQLNEVADRARPSGDTRFVVGDYNTVDLTLRTAGDWRKWNFAASIRNLFNTKAFEPTDTSVPGDLPLPGRSFYLQASYRI